jgi:hypothetical protein
MEQDPHTEQPKYIDLSIWGEVRKWFYTHHRYRRLLGVETLEGSSNSLVILTAPHGQEGITRYNPTDTSEEELLESEKPHFLRGFKRVGKGIVHARKESPSSGMGDSGSRQLCVETAQAYERETNKKTIHFVAPTISQRSIEANSGKPPAQQKIVIGMPTRVHALLEAIPFDARPIDIDALRHGSNRLQADEFETGLDFMKGTAITLALRLLQAYRMMVIERVKSINRKALILNIHTAFNRVEEKGGNPDIEVIIGTRHALSCDFGLEILFARFLKTKGFHVFDTSLIPIPEETATHPKSSLKPNLAYEGEVESEAVFHLFAKKYNIHFEEFTRDPVLETLGRLRGTQFIPSFQDALLSTGKKANIIQVEVVLKVTGDNNRRKQLAAALAEFSASYDNGIAGLKALNKEYKLNCDNFINTIQFS